MVTSLSNPKLAVFFVALFPQFIDAGAPVLPATLLMAAMLAIFDFAWYTALAVMVSRARQSFVRSRFGRWVERTTGAILIALGVRVAIEQRQLVAHQLQGVLRPPVARRRARSAGAVAGRGLDPEVGVDLALAGLRGLGCARSRGPAGCTTSAARSSWKLGPLPLRLVSITKWAPAERDSARPYSITRSVR